MSEENMDSKKKSPKGSNFNLIRAGDYPTDPSRSPPINKLLPSKSDTIGDDESGRAFAPAGSSFNLNASFKPYFTKDGVSAKDSLEMKDRPHGELHYRLKIDGDALEKEAWDLFVQRYFPNYERFWLAFVVPRTCRPDSIRTRPEIQAPESFLIMLHYTILRNLHFAGLSLNNAYDRQIFEQIYIRLSSAADVCEEFLFRFLLGQKGETIKEFIENNYNEELSAPIPPNLDKAVKKLEKGKDYNLRVIRKRQIIEKLSEKLDLQTFFSFCDSIRGYRNIIVHSWPLFQINQMCLTKEATKNWKYRDWVSVLNILQDATKREEFIQKNYRDMVMMVSEDFSSLVTLINDLWDRVLKKIPYPLE